MSLLSESIALSEALMKWREPNACSRKELSRGGWVVLLIVLLMPTILLSTSAVDHSLRRGEIILALIFVLLGALVFMRVWYGPGDLVCLKEDCITKATSQPPRRTLYENIECCNVRHDSYCGVKFCVLKFTLKGGLPAGQVEQVAVSDDANCDRVLHILRDKGVKVIQDPLPA